MEQSSTFWIFYTMKLRYVLSQTTPVLAPNVCANEKSQS